MTNDGKWRKMSESNPSPSSPDITVLKEVLGVKLGYDQKLRLCEVVKMLTGLRTSWSRQELREEPLPYSQEPPALALALFAHER